MSRAYFNQYNLILDSTSFKINKRSFFLILFKCFYNLNNRFNTFYKRIYLKKLFGIKSYIWLIEWFKLNVYSRTAYSFKFRQKTFVNNRQTLFFVVNWHQSKSYNVNWIDASIIMFYDVYWRSCIFLTIFLFFDLKDDFENWRQMTSLKHTCHWHYHHFSSIIVIIYFWIFKNFHKLKKMKNIVKKRHCCQ